VGAVHPRLRENALYKFELRTKDGGIRVKTDPLALKTEQAPNTRRSSCASARIHGMTRSGWVRARTATGRTSRCSSTRCTSARGRASREGDRALSYREIAPRLAAHVQALGFTHVELLPVMEHPFYGSWGYQVTGYYAPSSRYGTPDDFRYLVDTLHRAGIGVLLDWVPAHFPKDDYALRRFDGTALYEHEDPRLGEHPDWGTLIFNYGRKEVRNFLVANALYWLHEFHCDGLRVDAVASMLYLDYSRKHGEWVPNRYGGRENLEAIDFLAEMNAVVGEDAPGCVTMAEDSTAWPGVTRPIRRGRARVHLQVEHGVDARHARVLRARSDPPPFHQGELTFAMVYENSEHFIMPLSHDEMVHMKGSLYAKMPGDHWQKMANLRALFATSSRGRASRCCSWARSSRPPTSGTTTTRCRGTCWRIPRARRCATISRGWRTCTASCRRSGSATATIAASSGSTRATCSIRCCRTCGGRSTRTSWCS
jgi:1,4-alpha-glucan branching enzyme